MGSGSQFRHLLMSAEDDDAEDFAAEVRDAADAARGKKPREPGDPIGWSGADGPAAQRAKGRDKAQAFAREMRGAINMARQSEP